MKIIDIKGLTQPDPYILKSKENYYIYCTGADGIHCYKSSDLFEEWQHIGIVFSQQGQKEYWHLR